ncbi:MAG: magnesium/cobalt transporter CorA [Phycisphaerales bacterium]|nr:magnesium/cobalt transporter CorA [Phycisphaerales bacterium]
MTRRRPRSRIHPVGAVPGAIEQISPATPYRMSMFAFGSDRVVEHTPKSVQESVTLRENLPMLWLNFDGTPDAATLRALGAIYRLHPLALEDVLHPTRRAKVEPFAAVLFIVIPMPLTALGPFDTEQLAIFIGANFVITIQQKADGADCLDHVRGRIRANEGLLRERGSAFLAFTIIDSVIDYYFPLVNGLGERVDAIEDAVVASQGAADMFAIRDAKHELARVRQALWPMRDALTALITMESWFDLEHRIFLRNALDHVMRLIDMLDSDRMRASDLMELAIAIANARLGEVTKFLTMIATIFIPITFIAGVYGMNFEFMPELNWRFGYAMTLGVMLLVALVLLVVFWRRGWLAPSLFAAHRRPTNIN